MQQDDDNAVAVTDPFSRRLLSRYIARRQEELIALKSALATKKFDVIGQTAHKLYGSGSAYGLDEITRIGGELESAADRCDADKSKGLIAELERFVSGLSLP